MNNYRRVRVLFSDHLGLARGKYQPINTAVGGEARFCISLYGLTYDKQLLPVPGSGLLDGLPDVVAKFKEEDIRPSWEADTGVVIPDIEFKGEPLAHCGRNVLKKTIAQFEGMGLTPYVGIELEAYVFQKNRYGKWVPYDTPGAYVYGTGSTVDPAGLIDEVWEQAEACGIELESFNSEFDSPQFELTLKYDKALEAVDQIFLFKAMAKEIFEQNGYLLSFMPKPLSKNGGSGMHVNFSFNDKKGNNAIYDKSAKDGLSDIAKKSISGLVQHHEGMSALLAPTVNSYRRLLPASLSGYWANWGYDHRGVTTRIPDERGAGTRIEFRMADCAANPYTAVATVLQAAKLGIENDYELPDAETLDCLESQSTDRHVPDNLALALEALNADKDLCQAVGQELVDNHTAIKEQEWQDYSAHTTDWEFDQYLKYI